MDAVDDLGFLYLATGAPFISFTFVALVSKRRKIYRKLSLKNLKKDIEVEMYIVNIIDLIEDRGRVLSLCYIAYYFKECIRKRMLLEGLLKSHMKGCLKKASSCVCNALVTEFGNSPYLILL